jgi:hypothetical protein
MTLAKEPINKPKFYTSSAVFDDLVRSSFGGRESCAQSSDCHPSGQYSPESTSESLRLPVCFSNQSYYQKLERVLYDVPSPDPLVPMIIAYFVRAGYVMLEFGPRAFKTIKRVMSCGFGCVVLCRFGMNQGYQIVSWDAESCGTCCMVFFLVLKLVLKVLTLLNLFKTRKKLRIIKLLKITK